MVHIESKLGWTGHPGLTPAIKPINIRYLATDAFVAIKNSTRATLFHTGLFPKEADPCLLHRSTVHDALFNRGSSLSLS